MFNKLVASSAGARGWLRNPGVIVVSVAAHALVLGGIVWGSMHEPLEEPPPPEQITYIDITELPPPPDEVYEAPPEPAAPPPAEQASLPAAPRAAPRAPATPRAQQPAAAATEEPAGFQELGIPDVDIAGIPAPDVTAPAVRAEDFGGRGAVGGTATGAPPLPAPAGAGQGAGGTGEGGSGRTFTANLVDEQAEMINRGDISRILSRGYPQSLREAGVEGRVIVQFVVNQNGRVEPGSVKVMSSTQPEFEEATRSALQEFRFRPAKKQGHPVRQVVQVPVSWQLTR